MLNKLFGGQKKAAPAYQPSTSAAQPSGTRTLDALDKLTETEGLLIKRRDLLEKQIANELEKAKTALKAKNERAAKMHLKKKKMYEGQLEAIENNILRINEQQMMLQNQTTMLETVGALEHGAKASKEAMKTMNIDNVDKVFDTINEQTDKMREIQDRLGETIVNDLDEDEIDVELEELAAAQQDEELLEPGPVPSTRVEVDAGLAALPSVPAARPAAAKAPVKKTAEDLELEALQAELL